MKLTRNRKPHVAPNLATPAGRRRAQRELVLGDHGFLREHFQNLHVVGPGMWRSNQPSPSQIADHVRLRGIKTIINLRGDSTKGYYLLEKEACETLGVDLVDFRVYSRDTPDVDTIRGARDLFSEIAYPALMHCKSGADRAGLMAALYCIFRLGQPVNVAARQLSKRYLHLREGKTGLLDAVFEAYMADAAAAGDEALDFMSWVETDYDREQVKQAFLKSGQARLGLDRLLRRE